MKHTPDPASANCFAGTRSHISFSCGNCLPLSARPWGTHHWTPVNRWQESFLFEEGQPGFHGLRLTHAPSPWMEDWCFLTLLPQIGPLVAPGDARHAGAVPEVLDIQPHRLRIRCEALGFDLSASPSPHGLCLELDWLGEGPRHVILDSNRASAKRGNQPARFRVDRAKGEIDVRVHNGHVPHPDFALHAVLRFDQGFADTVELADGCLALVFDPACARIRLLLAASFLDAAQARFLLEHELTGRGLDAVAAEGAAAWSDLFGRIEVPADQPSLCRQKNTAIYRACLFPRRLDEPCPDGKIRHRCPDTGRVFEGTRCTDNGFWDTARTVYSLYALLFRDHLPDFLEGWLAGARSTGWFPSWASPGHRDCMTGSYIDAVYAEAHAAAVPGWSVEEALVYLRKHCEVEVSDNAPYGRIALDEWLALGFVSVDRINKATARTLDYAYGDWCIARLARAAGDIPLAEACERRSFQWQNVLDPTTGFFRGRHRDGSWLEPWDPILWGGPYVEGSAWQFAWHLPHHARELIAARGGPEKSLAFLDALLAEPPAFHVGTYGFEIHEMSEMAAVDFGQYAHSNQPSHFTLPYFGHLGAPGKLRHWVHRVATELYRDAPDGFPGDEDNGEMCSWWLGALIGLLPHCAGSGQWMRCAPLCPGIVLHPPGLSPIKVDRIAASEGGLVSTTAILGLDGAI